jgi:hypothetical protein
MVLAAAGGSLVCPNDAELHADEMELGITALFDGADLERI